MRTHSCLHISNGSHFFFLLTVYGPALLVWISFWDFVGMYCLPHPSRLFCFLSFLCILSPRLLSPDLISHCIFANSGSMKITNCCNCCIFLWASGQAPHCFSHCGGKTNEAQHINYSIGKQALSCPCLTPVLTRHANTGIQQHEMQDKTINKHRPCSWPTLTMEQQVIQDLHSHKLNKAAAPQHEDEVGHGKICHLNV